MLTLIENGQVYAPEPLGRTSVLLANDRIIRVGSLDRTAVETFARTSELPLDVIDAAGCVVIPGLIDPHEHLSGAGGEQGFASRMPEVSLEQIIMAGITTVVGLLGTDTVTREPSCLYAKVNQLNDEGITAYMYTGGFELPPRTLTQSVIDDMVYIQPVIGVGEVAIADTRWINPPLQDLAFVAAQSALGGKMSGKAGVTHFHVGERDERLSLLHALLDHYPLEPTAIYATHIERSEALMDDAIRLAGRGGYVDMDTIERTTPDCIRYYLNGGGPVDRLTVSSDAHTPAGSPAKFYSEFVRSVRDAGLSLEMVLLFFSTNAADVLQLHGKGRIVEGGDGDIAVLREDTLDLVHVFARGRQFVRASEPVVKTRQRQALEEGQV